MTTFEYWLEKTADNEAINAELRAIADNPREIEERFSEGLEFGTGGLRGIIGAGTNRMNIYTVARATAGFASFLKKHFASPSAVISYDSRNYSEEFARVTAEVFASEGVKAYIFDRLMPTPVCSYAVRELGASGGVMVTASHNPKIYNGYKAYGPDGCQFADSGAVTAEIEAIEDYFSVKHGDFDALKKEEMIEYVPERIYENFLKAAESLALMEGGKKNIRIVYTPLNGTGLLPVTEVLRRRGFGSVFVVPEQEKPDGNFTTCPYPNPEERAALKLAVELGEKINADIVIATDPDCDRVGIAAPDTHGEFVLYTGNETAMMLLEYMFSIKVAAGTLPTAPAIITTIVTAGLCGDIARTYGSAVYEVLTGFKHIGDRIAQMETSGALGDFVLGFEESYGYLAGTYVRDKDAVSAAMLLAEMCEYYHNKGMTLDAVLEGIYQKYGYYKSRLVNIAFSGAGALKAMGAKMAALRKNPPAKLGDYRVLEVKDYIGGLEGLPPSDVIAFYFEDGKVLCRPSGTEPKLKIYTMGKGAESVALSTKLQKIETSLAGFFS